MTHYSLQCHHDYMDDNIDSHMTLVYLGKQSKKQLDNVPLGTLLFELTRYFPLTTRSEGLADFGPTGETKVRLLNPNNHLISAQAIALNFFFQHGIDVPVTYPYFRPHITIHANSRILKNNTITLFLPHLVKWED